MHLALRSLLVVPMALSLLFVALACQAQDAESAEKKEASVSQSGTSDASPGGVAAIEAFIAEQNIDKSKAGWKTSLPRPPKQSFDPAKTYKWLLETNQGNLAIELMPQVAPMHVTSTIYLTKLGFYDGVPFHRVIPGFMAQGGDPTGTGSGGPGYKYAGEFDSSVKHDEPGLLSMANAGPNTDGSQFFLTFTPTPHLDGKHTIFGKVVEGMGTVKSLESKGTPSGRPTEKLEITRATLVVE